MRAYFFGNMYLSSIQQGIQALHATSEMFMKYVTVSEDYELTADPKRLMLWDWAKNHKTVVLLNGGFSDTIRDVAQFFDNNENPYPWADFYEDEDALDGALTDVGIILPEKIYEAARLVRSIRVSGVASMTPRDCIWNTGELTILPNNNWGVTTDETIEWTYTKWEAQLIDKLNEFGLAN